MPSTLPYYWQLASASKKDRLASSHSLVQTLTTQQKEADLQDATLPENGKPFDDGLDAASVLQLNGKIVEEAEHLLDVHNSTEVTYAIRRLLKGLASHRESSRLGFSVALCELIHQLKSLPARHIITLVLSYSSSSGKVKLKGQEERDFLFARLFGLYAVIRSGILLEERLAREEDFRRAVEIVWLLGRSKTWLRESSGWIIAEAVRSISASNVPWKKGSLDWLAGKICEAREVGPESVAIYLSLSDSSDSMPTLPTLISSELLASVNLAPLARILKEGVGAEESSQMTGGGSVQMQVHFVWDQLLREYSVKPAKADANNAPLPEMYRVLVDEALFATSASDQKKSWGFQIFEKALQTVADEDVSCLLTANFMRTWTNQLADRTRMLHKAALRCVTTTQEVVKQRPNIGMPILSKLLIGQGSSSFPAKVVEGILSSMSSSEGVNHYIDYLTHSTMQDSDSTRRWAIDQLASVARNSSLPVNEDCICTIFAFFAAHGFFTMTTAPSTSATQEIASLQLPDSPFSASIKSVCRTRFLSSLGDVCDQSFTHDNAQGRVKKRQGQMLNGQPWISRASSIIEAMEMDPSHFTALCKREKKDGIARGRDFSQKLAKTAKKSSTSEGKTKVQDFNSMLLAGTLYLYKDLSRNEEFEAGLVDSMIECGNRLVLGQAGQEGEPSAMGLFIHCVVSYMEQPSAFLRSASTQAFATFSDELNRDGLDQLLDQLGFREDKTAADEGEEADENVDDEDGDEEEEEVLSDSVSVTSATSVSSSKDNAVDPVLAAKVQEVLRGGRAADSDAESSASDDEEGDSASSLSSSEASDFDDDQMMLIDEKLADIFRQKLGTRKEEDEARKETVALHIKLVDLLDVYARKQIGNELCVAMVLPLFTIALEKDATLGQLKQRASIVLSKAVCKMSDGLSGTIPAASVIDSMEAVHKMAATKLPTPAMNLCSTVNNYLTKACKEEDLVQGQVRNVYLATLQDFIQRKSSNLRPQFLIDAFQRSPLLGFSLRHELLEAASGPQETGKDSYRQLQALEMLRVTLVNYASSAKEKDELVVFLPLVSKKILDIVAKGKLRLKEIVKVALDLARLSKRVCADQADVERIWSLTRINEVIASIAAKDELPNAVSLQSLLRQLLAVVSDQETQKATSNGKRKGEQELPAQKKKKKQQPHK